MTITWPQQGNKSWRTARALSLLQRKRWDISVFFNKTSVVLKLITSSPDFEIDVYSDEFISSLLAEDRLTEQEIARLKILLQQDS